VAGAEFGTMNQVPNIDGTSFAAFSSGQRGKLWLHRSASGLAFTLGEIWRIAAKGTGAWISAQIDCALGQIAFAQGNL
jgi:hypothetical protein